ncbi:MAG TPA: hypothetical protein DCM05_10010 [Elusimicrobia bacterium]|nr:hypothetical protein [Elusimicrobiota bacterium]
MHADVRRYLSRIGRLGGLKSRRALSPETAREMVRLREARRAFSRFKTSCFWSFDPARLIGPADIPWVVEQLQKNGGWQAWEVAMRLSHRPKP